MRTLNNLHDRSWKCSPAEKDGETPARKRAGQTPRVKDGFGRGTRYFGAESAPTFVKGQLQGTLILMAVDL